VALGSGRGMLRPWIGELMMNEALKSLRARAGYK